MTDPHDVICAAMLNLYGEADYQHPFGGWDQAGETAIAALSDAGWVLIRQQGLDALVDERDEALARVAQLEHRDPSNVSRPGGA